MKKLLFGAALGAVAGAVSYKMYKENEDKVKDFLAEHLDGTVDIDDIDLEDLEELRDCIDDMIDAKIYSSDMECEFDREAGYDIDEEDIEYDFDEGEDDSDEEADYILLKKEKEEKEENK